MTGIGHRIQWLQPPERQVYKIWRTSAPTPTSAPETPVDEGVDQRCVRSGARVGRGEVGFATRARGTLFAQRDVGLIHRRCVPTREFETAGLPARRRMRA